MLAEDIRQMWRLRGHFIKALWLVGWYAGTLPWPLDVTVWGHLARPRGFPCFYGYGCYGESTSWSSPSYAKVDKMLSCFAVTVMLTAICLTPAYRSMIVCIVWRATSGVMTSGSQVNIHSMPLLAAVPLLIKVWLS